MAQLIFPAEVPPFSELVAEAERLGGMMIESATDGQNQVVVAFSEFPKGQVTVTSDANQLFVADLSLVAPILFELLLKAGVSLGGNLHLDFPWSPLSLPLSKEAISTATRKVHLASAIVSIILLSAIVGAVAIIAGIVCALSRHVT